MSDTRVVFIGDSTLDNYHWVLPDKDGTVAKQLELRLNPNSQIVNLAVDGFNTSNVLGFAHEDDLAGDPTGEFRDNAFPRDTDDQHPHERIFPLKELEKLAADGSSLTHIVLSVGGNDLRESLKKLIGLEPASREHELNSLLQRMQENYINIIEQCKHTCPNAHIMMMLQYTPGIHPDKYFIYFLMEKILENKHFDIQHPPRLLMADFMGYKLFGRSTASQDRAVRKLHDLMEVAYAPLIQYAKQHGIPVLDMATTFDETNKDLYIRQIEPSHRGAKLIAEMMAYAVEHHDFNGPSFIYAKPSCESASGPIIAIENNGTWRPHAIPEDHPQAEKYFLAEHERQLKRDKTGASHVFGLFTQTKVSDTDTLDSLKNHATQYPNRTKAVMEKIGWNVSGFRS